MFTKKLDFSSKNNTATISGNLVSTTVGLKNLKFELTPIPSEKNIQNNTKEVVIEVIDQQTRIALVANILHPDLGTLKKSIEQNQQRAATIISVNDLKNKVEEFDFFVLYQPDPSFESIFKVLENKKANVFIITGPKTNWNFLNQVQQDFSKSSYNESDDVQGIPNSGYENFKLNDFDTSNYPPLVTNLGELTLNTDAAVLMYQKIRGVTLAEPLLFTFENNEQKKAVLMGEGLWRWRVQNYKEETNFDGFDQFIEKLMRYMADSNSKSRLSVDYEPVYSSPQTAKIKATIFDESYVFDSNAQLVIQLSGAKNISIPFLLKSDYFEADLSSLPTGQYQFNLKDKKSGLAQKGAFKIIDFNIENQQINANSTKLERFAKNQGTTLYYPNQITSLLDYLKQDDSFIPIQKSTKTEESLIEFWVLLLVIALSFATEWFIRKYNGLI